MSHPQKAEHHSQSEPPPNTTLWRDSFLGNTPFISRECKTSYSRPLSERTVDACFSQNEFAGMWKSAPTLLVELGNLNVE